MLNNFYNFIIFQIDNKKNQLQNFILLNKNNFNEFQKFVLLFQNYISNLMDSLFILPVDETETPSIDSTSATTNIENETNRNNEEENEEKVIGENNLNDHFLLCEAITNLLQSCRSYLWELFKIIIDTNLVNEQNDNEANKFYHLNNLYLKIKTKIISIKVYSKYENNLKNENIQRLLFYLNLIHDENETEVNSEMKMPI